MKYVWATVTAVSPLAIRIDTEVDPLVVPPESLVGGLQIGDRVWVQLYGRQAIVLGRAGGGDTGYVTTGIGFSMSTGWSLTAAVWRIIGNVAHIYVRAAATSTHTLNAANATITNATLCTVPSQLAMASTGFAQGLTGGNSRVASAMIIGNTITIAAVAGTGDIASGADVTVAGSYVVGV